MRPPPRHALPPRIWPGLTACALLAVASLGGIAAPHAEVRMHAGASGRAERVVAAVLPSVVPVSMTPWDPALVPIDDGKAPGDAETTARACRCAPRQPVVVGVPSVSNAPLSRPSVPRTASTPSAGIRTTPHTTTTAPSATQPVETTAGSSATPTRTTNAAETTVDPSPSTTDSTATEETE